MEAFDYWKLCDELNIMQAALLIIGVDPSSKDGCHCESLDLDERPFGYEAAKIAISIALMKKTISGQHISLYDYDIDGDPCGEQPNTTDIQKSIVEVASLQQWLSRRGFRTGFFFPVTIDAPDYMDKKNPRFAPKLVASVRAWQAVSDPGKKSPKQALEKWLREHAAEFGLVDDDGNPVNNAIEECSKVANWSQGGGAPKMPDQ